MGIVELEGAVGGGGAEVGFPIALCGTGVAGRFGQEAPGAAVVVGVGDCDAEKGVGARGGVFAVVAEGAEDAFGGGGELDEEGVVDVVGVGGAAGDFTEGAPGGAVVGGGYGLQDVVAGLEACIDAEDAAIAEAGGSGVGAGAEDDGGTGQGGFDGGSREELGDLR